MDLDLKYFNKTSNKLPNFLKKKLDKMPNNKGFIWKDIWFFGKLPPESNLVFMFEKIDNDLFIKEIGTKYTKTFKKTDKGKILISSVKNKKLVKY